jgi:hypothetical protein
MVQAIGLIVLGYVAAMVTVLVFKKPPATPSEAADEKLRQQISDKIDTLIDDVAGTV